MKHIDVNPGLTVTIYGDNTVSWSPDTMSFADVKHDVNVLVANFRDELASALELRRAIIRMSTAGVFWRVRAGALGWLRLGCDADRKLVVQTTDYVFLATRFPSKAEASRAASAANISGCAVIRVTARKRADIQSEQDREPAPNTPSHG